MRIKVTLSIFLTCISVFALQIYLYTTYGISLVERYALYPPVISEEPYRIITSMFLHGGLDHLAQNMFALLLFGTVLEGLIGSKRYLVVYLLAGIAGNLAGIVFYPDSYSLGASGAIMGIVGCLVVLRPFMMVWFGGPMPLIMLAGMWVFVDLAGLFDPYSRIGNAAHLAGIITGMFIGRKLKKQFDEKKLAKKRAREEVISDKEIEEWERKWMFDYRSIVKHRNL